MTNSQPNPLLPVHYRGLLAKSLFFMFVFAPSVSLSAAAVWFCVSQDRPILIAAGGLMVSALLVDHFAYHVFCQVVLTPEGLLYRGGGIIWKKVRKERALPWSEYVYTFGWRGGYYTSLDVAEKSKRSASGMDDRSRAQKDGREVLSLVPRISAYSQFEAFVRQTMRYNPEVKMRSTGRFPKPTVRTPPVRKEDIQISGDPEFIRMTVNALDLMKERDPVNYKRVQRYLKRIESVEPGYPAVMNLETAVCQVSTKPPSLRRAELYASLIVHEMCHYMLHHRFKSSAYLPENKARHQEMCFRAEVRFLRRLGISEEEVQRLEQIPGVRG